MNSKSTYMTNNAFVQYLYIIELNLGLFGAWNIEHVKHLHKVVTCAKLFVASENFLRRKMTETTKAKMFLIFDICNI